MTLVTPTGRVAYRGRLRAVPVKSGSPARDTVNATSLENYVKGVVPREMPATWSPEAVQAQSVAARTYAAYERAHPLTSRYQICDTTSCQVYGGVTSEHPASNRAVNATRREIRTYRGDPAFTQFSSSNGGWARRARCPTCPRRRIPTTAGPEPQPLLDDQDHRLRIESVFPRIGNLRKIVVTRRDGNGQWGGRVGAIRLVGSAASVTVSGDTFRFALGLKSQWVTFEVEKALSPAAPASWM